MGTIIAHHVHVHDADEGEVTILVVGAGAEHRHVRAPIRSRVAFRRRVGHRALTFHTGAGTLEFSARTSRIARWQPV